MKQLNVVKGSSFLDSAVVSERVYDIVQLGEKVYLSAKSVVSEWYTRSVTRSDLARLSPRMLRDIGLEPFEAQVEINKPFWRK